MNVMRFIREQKSPLNVGAFGAAILACEPEGTLGGFAVSAFVLGVATAALSHARLESLRKHEKPYMRGLVR